MSQGESLFRRSISPAMPGIAGRGLRWVLALFLLWTAGLLMVCTRIPTLAVASPGACCAWLALYNAIYIVPLLLIVLAFVGTLSAHKPSEREGRLLKLMSGVMMFQLGLVRTFYRPG